MGVEVGKLDATDVGGDAGFEGGAAFCGGRQGGSIGQLLRYFRFDGGETRRNIEAQRLLYFAAQGVSIELGAELQEETGGLDRWFQVGEEQLIVPNQRMP